MESKLLFNNHPVQTLKNATEYAIEEEPLEVIVLIKNKEGLWRRSWSRLGDLDSAVGALERVKRQLVKLANLQDPAWREE